MSILLQGLTKRFGNLPVVENVSLEIADGELFVLLGASGSGKSTILRLIAGLALPDNGRIVLHGRDVTRLPPQRRGTGFVFQNYSIFRHMSVAENIEFGLKIRKMPPGERSRRRDELLELVGLTGLGARYAHQISGGQQQRVALARALAYEPNVLLLDEPFGALDVKIRAQLRRSLKQIQRQLGVTTIMVTHDQEEAFELADRIGVIERGRLLEIGDPESLYRRPQSAFVATFLGSGTVLTGRVTHGTACFGSFELPIPPDSPHEDGARVQVLLRPEQIVLSDARPAGDRPIIGQGTVIEQLFAGATRRVRLRLPRVPGVRQTAPRLPFGEQGLLIDALLPADAPIAASDYWLSARGWHILKPPQMRLLVVQTTHESLPSPRLMTQLTHQLHATVTLLGVASDPDAAAPLQQSLLSQVALLGPQAETRARHGDPVEQIAAEQAESLYDLLILPVAGHESRGGLDPLALGVLERANAVWATPILLLRHGRAAINRVLICTAAGEPGKSDVRVGGRLARRLGAAVTLLHVTRPGATIAPQAQEHLRRAVATLLAMDVEADSRTRAAASPVEGILAEAQAGDYDLIVLGSHGPVARSIFGRDDVALQVAARFERPVLIVPDESV